MEHPKDVGDRSTLAIIITLRELGYGIYLPFGENTRADLILERAGEVARVQCKTGRLRQGAIRFPVCSSYAHHPNPKMRWRDYRGDVEYFAVYCRDTAAVYLVPIDDLPVIREGSLRVSASRNNQREGIRFAADYEIGRVAIGGLRASSGA
jgi:PD-(D/E)XK nuclease superfamily protein